MENVRQEMGSFFFSRNGKTLFYFAISIHFHFIFYDSQIGILGKQADFHVFIEPGIGMLVTIERGHDKIVIDLRFIGKTIDRFP